MAVEAPWMISASKRQRYLVGVSGGADSVALLQLLVDAGFHNLIVCHLDHRLRGRASAADARFVEKLASKLGVTFELGRDAVKQRMQASGMSMETAARVARHDFFADCAKTHRCKRVLLAHHAEDQAETVLWNLLRGSHGLKGMREQQEIAVGQRKLQFIRPLLGVRKAELVGWLEERGLSWCEDATNGEPIAVRNRLRNEVMPLLAEVSGRDPVAAITRSAIDAAEWHECVAEMLDQAELLDPQGRIHLPALRKLPALLQRTALHDFLASHQVSGIDRALLDRAVGMLDVSNPAVINLPGGKWLRRRSGRIWVDHAAPPDR